VDSGKLPSQGKSLWQVLLALVEVGPRVQIRKYFCPLRLQSAVTHVTLGGVSRGGSPLHSKGLAVH